MSREIGPRERARTARIQARQQAHHASIESRRCGRQRETGKIEEEEMSNFKELAMRCEDSVASDRELDGLIFKALEQRDGDMWTTFGDENVWHRRDPQDHCAFDPPPNYTGSVDTAMKFIPAYMSSELTSSAASAFTRCRLWDWRRSPTMAYPGNEWKAEGNRPLPLNICAAVLRYLAET